MDVDAGGGGTTAELEALEGVPLLVGGGIGVDAVDADMEVLEVDDVGVPGVSDVVVADVELGVVEQEEDIVEARVDLHRLLSTLACDEEVVETVGGTGGGTALVVDIDCDFGSIDHVGTIDELNDHGHVVGILVVVDRGEDARHLQCACTCTERSLTGAGGWIDELLGLGAETVVHVSIAGLEG